jgi:hypothetical protein
MSDLTATVERSEPERFILVRSKRGWHDFKEDLLPLWALLGAIYGWVFALLVAAVAAVVLIIR